MNAAFNKFFGSLPDYGFGGGEHRGDVLCWPVSKSRGQAPVVSSLQEGMRSCCRCGVRRAFWHSRRVHRVCPVHGDALAPSRPCRETLGLDSAADSGFTCNAGEFPGCPRHGKPWEFLLLLHTDDCSLSGSPLDDLAPYMMKGPLCIAN